MFSWPGPIAQVVIGGIFGILPAIAWALKGGDESFKTSNPIVRDLLKFIHHWQLGILFLVPAWVWEIPFLWGFGFIMFLDDALFHSFENYFARKEKK